MRQHIYIEKPKNILLARLIKICIFFRSALQNLEENFSKIHLPHGYFYLHWASVNLRSCIIDGHVIWVQVPVIIEKQDREILVYARDEMDAWKKTEIGF